MRAINKILIHSTGTPEYAAVSLSDIDRQQNDKGLKDIGYHYVIGINGEIWQGIDVSIAGKHSSGNNTDDSIDVVYVGGMDGKNKPKDTRNEAQNEALEDLISELKNQFPKATVEYIAKFD